MSRYPSLANAQRAVTEMGEALQRSKLPKGISPMTFVFTGTGNVSQGAQEIFRLVPHEMVKASDLPEVVKSGRNDVLYGCVATAADMVENKTGAPFNKTE